MAIENTNKQVWILTSAGIRRINEVMESPSVERLYVTKIKIGNANGEYYVPVQGTDNDLRDPIIQGGHVVEFPISEKQLNDSTVTFKTVIPESSGGYTIREIGLYETINNVDTCIALGTCEPIVKPPYDPIEDYGYAMSIDYRLNINSVNLATIYDQIELDAESEYVTKEMLEALSRTVLFVEGNLMDQISVNSHLLGLNRAQQLSDLIEDTRSAYANVAVTNIYSNLLNSVDLTDVKGFWAFGYTEKFDEGIAVKDLSPYGNNFNLSKPAATFDSGIFSVLPYMDFSNGEYFNSLYAPSLKMNDEFTFMFTGQINTAGTVKTLLAQSNPNSNRHNWSIQINENNSVVVKVYSSPTAYKVYTSGLSVIPNGPFTLAVVYEDHEISCYLNTIKISMNKTTTGSYGNLAQNDIETTTYLINEYGQKSQLIDSKVCGMTLIGKALEDPVIRATELCLLALVGKNIYRGS